MSINAFFLLAVLAVVSVGSGTRAFAQRAASQPPKRLSAPVVPTYDDGSQLPSDDDLQLMRKDLRSQKKQIVAANMDLTDTEAQKFWPVYDQYTAELTKINDSKAALYREYFESFSSMNDNQAETYIQKRAAVEKSITDLRIKYIPAFRKVLSGKQTARFFQIEWRLGVLIDMQLAQAPLIEP